MSSEKKYVTPYISNKRFEKIKERLSDHLKESSAPSLENILQIICDETNYDPNVKQYDERKAEAIKRYQKKKREEERIKRTQSK